MRVNIIIVVLAAIILVTARISYVTLFSSISPRDGAVTGIGAKARAERQSGVQFLVRLAKEGNLPGINKGDHRNMSARSGKISFPYSMTFQIVKTGDTSRYNYQIVQFAEDSEWRLM